MLYIDYATNLQSFFHLLIKLSDNLSKMHDLSKFKKGKIVEAQMAGVSISKIAKLFVFSRPTISSTITEFSKRRKTLSSRKNFLENF